jgi:Sec-independent protein secretion pathway component TatC
MPLAIQLYDVVLSVHVMAVLIAFGAWFAYPVLVTGRDAASHLAQARIARVVVTPAATVAFIAGAFLATDRSYWSESWVSVPLLILVVLLGINGAYFIPRQRRLAELAQAGGASTEYEELAAKVARIYLVCMALVLVAVFFMVAKPFS